jgi:hypothetical protein
LTPKNRGQIKDFFCVKKTVSLCCKMKMRPGKGTDAGDRAVKPAGRGGSKMVRIAKNGWVTEFGYLDGSRRWKTRTHRGITPEDREKYAAQAKMLTDPEIGASDEWLRIFGIKMGVISDER